MKVLIAEDDKLTRNGLAELLSDEGYEVVEADDGEEAIQQFDANLPDFVCLDVMMPKLSGYEVCRHIRETHPMHKLPVIFLTAKTSDDALATGMEAGGNDFLTKPTSKAILLPKVSSLLRMSRETQNN